MWFAPHFLFKIINYVFDFTGYSSVNYLPRCWIRVSIIGNCSFCSPCSFWFEASQDECYCSKYQCKINKCINSNSFVSCFFSTYSSNDKYHDWAHKDSDWSSEWHIVSWQGCFQSNASSQNKQSYDEHKCMKNHSWLIVP